jgi:hypothetical protein
MSSRSGVVYYCAAQLYELGLKRTFLVVCNRKKSVSARTPCRAGRLLLLDVNYTSSFRISTCSAASAISMREAAASG